MPQPQPLLFTSGHIPPFLNPRSLITTSLSKAFLLQLRRYATFYIWRLVSWGIAALFISSPSRDVDPTEDFCSLSSHMSRALPGLLKYFVLLFIYQRSKYIVVQNDGILYIAGGYQLYLQEYISYDGPSLYPLPMLSLLLIFQAKALPTPLDIVLRSLNISDKFKTSVDSVSYVQPEEIPGTIPGFSNAALFPTESGFDLTLGEWEPYNNTKRGPPIEKKWQYDISTQRWTDAGVTLKHWFQINAPRRISSSMTAWIPSMKKGFLFGGTFSSVNGTSPNATRLPEHNGLITYDQATNTWTNESTQLEGISDGGLVHITTATDEVLIQFGGVSRFHTYVV